MLNETELIPYHAVQTLGTGRVLVLAPHPDDEVFGCAGAIMRHVAGGDPVTVIVLTDGGGFQGDDLERESYAAQRRQESRAAAAILGYGEPQFWEYRDRELVYDEPLVQRLRDAVLAAEARWLYAPSPYELHPDHRHLALAALEVARRLGGELTLAFYEIGAPLPPNRLLDISDVLERKRQAIACFTSQLAMQAYDRHVEALNRYRTYTLPREVEAAEAYWVLEGSEVAGMTLDTIPGLLTVQHTAPVRENTEINALSRAEMDASPSDGISLPLVDVIIPVYRGLDETQRCLNSVLAFPQQTTHEVVVIDDCSPERELSAWLRDLADTGAITLLENPVNTGFVNAVNRGMVLHLDRDVVLLNSDTEVHGDWLDRLRRHARSDSLVGTVTPFSNNATICSYPRFCEENYFSPSDNKLAELDALFAEINNACTVEIPTAVGFCMYITRRCIEQVGYFDAERFGRGYGYGEENDFCLRASELGFKHLLCADTFVYHQGAVSFGLEHQFLASNAMKRLKAFYPFYDRLIASHVVADPARQARRRVDWTRLTRSSKPCVLFVTHHFGGGTEKHVRELACLLETRFEILILQPNNKDQVALEWARRGEEFKLYFTMPVAFDSLVKLLQKAKVLRIHFHHLIGHHPSIASLPRKLGLPYDFTLHDYFSICPQFNLTLSNGRYCGEPGVEGCNTCLEERPQQWQLDISAWRGYFDKLLASAERVIAPSQDVMNRIRKYIPNANFIYLPHPEVYTVKVLVLGMKSTAKEALQLELCVKDAKKRNLPLFYRVLDFSCYEKPPIGMQGGDEPDLPISLSRPYNDSDLPTLITSEQADIIYFPAQWPETYSYILSAVICSQLPIVAPKLGAIAERLSEYTKAYLIEWDASYQTVNDLLLEIMDKKSTAEDSKFLFGAMKPDTYLEKYTKEIITVHSPLPQAAEKLGVRVIESTPQPPLNLALDPMSSIFDETIKVDNIYPEPTDLMIDNLSRSRLIEMIKCLVGSPSNEILKWSAVEAWRDELLAKQNALADQLVEKQHLTGQCEELQQQVLNKKSVIQEMYLSNSWRLTQPFRWLSQKYRRWFY